MKKINPKDFPIRVIKDGICRIDINHLTTGMTVEVPESNDVEVYMCGLKLNPGTYEVDLNYVEYEKERQKFLNEPFLPKWLERMVKVVAIIFFAVSLWFLSYLMGVNDVLHMYTNKPTSFLP